MKATEESKSVSKDVVSNLIGTLGLSFEEALMRFMLESLSLSFRKVPPRERGFHKRIGWGKQYHDV